MRFSVFPYALALLALLALNFALPLLMPGDAAVAFLGQDALVELSDAQRHQLLAELELDQPLWRQAWAYLGRLARLDLGFSFRHGQPVAALLAEHLPWTLLLTACALGLALVAGTLLGMEAALAQARWPDRALTTAMLALESLPAFAIAMGLALPATLALIVLAAAFRPGAAALAAWLALLGWDAELRTLRARLHALWRHESLDAARMAGASALYLLRRHALPALAGLMAMQLVGLTRRGVFHYAGLAFLGLTDPRQPTWGGMLSDAMPWLGHPAALWCALPAAVCLACLLIGLALLGQGLDQRKPGR